VRAGRGRRWRCTPSQSPPELTLLDSRAAGPPHKGQTCAVRLVRRLDLSFISFRRGGEMCVVLILFWCWAVVGRWLRSNILPDNSRFGGFGSRLGPREFPVRIATGIRSQALDSAPRFCGQTAALWGKSMKFPVSTGKTGNCGLRPVTGRSAVTGTCGPPAAGRGGSGRRFRNGRGGLGPVGSRRGCRAGGARTGSR
jgi:hypothetical protein